MKVITQSIDTKPWLNDSVPVIYSFCITGHTKALFVVRKIAESKEKESFYKPLSKAFSSWRRQEQRNKMVWKWDFYFVTTS